MKRIFIFGLIAVFLIVIFALSSAPVSAASTQCAANPGSASVGTIFTVTCSGFLPGEQTNAWVTEPDGAVFSYTYSLFGPAANGKADSSGNVTYSFDSAFRALGEYALTVKGSLAIGIARFTVTGGTEGVSGATLTNNDSTIIGTGFAPFEIVSVWFDYPNGDCSANWFAGPGRSSSSFGSFKADAGGSFAFVFALDPFWDCSGTYHIVARGNTSQRGGDTYWTTPNHPVTENAFLFATPDPVLALGEFISFSGSGFAPFESVSCWETTPQGAVLPLSSHKADGAGGIAFGFFTGTDLGFVVPSEGALGEWAVSCQGDKSGAIGIARFTVTGGIVDP